MEISLRFVQTTSNSSHVSSTNEIYGKHTEVDHEVPPCALREYKSNIPIFLNRFYRTRLFKVCLIVWVNQQGTVLSNACSENGKNEQFCSKEEKIKLFEIDRKLKFTLEAAGIVRLLFTIVDKTDLSQLRSVTIEKASDWLLQHVDKYPEAAGFIGVGISIWLLTDSMADVEEMNRIYREYDDLAKTQVGDYKDSEQFLKHMIKRSNQIRAQAIAVKSWQGRMGFLKTIIATVFGWIGLSTSSPVLKPLAYLGSLYSGLGALINGYNWGALHNLVHRLEQAGYII